MGGEKPPIRPEAMPDPIEEYEQAFEIVVTRLNAPPVTHLCVGSDTVASLKRAIEFATRVPVQSQVLVYTPPAPLGTKPPKLVVWPARRHPVEGTKVKIWEGMGVGSTVHAMLEDEGKGRQLLRVRLGKAIMQGRTAKKLTQKQLATSLNEKPQVIMEYESGKAIPNPQIISKIERALGVKLPRPPKKEVKVVAINSDRTICVRRIVKDPTSARAMKQTGAPPSAEEKAAHKKAAKEASARKLRAEIEDKAAGIDAAGDPNDTRHHAGKQWAYEVETIPQDALCGDACGGLIVNDNRNGTFDVQYGKNIETLTNGVMKTEIRYDDEKLKDRKVREDALVLDLDSDEVYVAHRKKLTEQLGARHVIADDECTLQHYGLTASAAAAEEAYGTEVGHLRPSVSAGRAAAATERGGGGGLDGLACGDGSGRADYGGAIAGTLVLRLFERLASETLSTVDANGDTPLHLALYASDEAAAAQLSSVVDVNRKNAHGDTPLLVAISLGLGRAVHALLRGRAHVTRRLKDADGKELDARDPERTRHMNSQTGFTPILAAACEGHDDVVTLIARALAARDPALDERAGGYTALHWLAMKGHAGGGLDSLIARGADLNAQAAVEKKAVMGGGTALVKAAQYNAVECVEQLRKAGAALCLSDRAGRNPLHYAARNGSVACLRKLLETSPPSQTFVEAATEVRAAACAQDRTGCSPTQYAMQSGSVECSQLLKLHGAALSGDEKLVVEQQEQEQREEDAAALSGGCAAQGIIGLDFLCSVFVTNGSRSIPG